MKNLWEKNKEIFCKSCTIKIFNIFILDVLFYGLSAIIIWFFSSQLGNFYSKVQLMMENLQAVDIASATLMTNLMRELVAKSVFYFIFVVFLIFVLFVFVKGYIYTYIHGIKYEKKFLKKFAKYSLIWLGIGFFPVISLLFLLLVSQQLGNEMLSFSIIISQVFLILLFYWIMVSNLMFPKVMRYHAILESFKIGFNFRIVFLPVLVLIGVFIIMNFAWNIIAHYITISENGYFIVLSIIILFIYSWFRHYLSLIFKSQKVL